MRRKENMRQNMILAYLKENPASASSVVIDHIEKTFSGKNSRPTILRDIDHLTKEGIIIKSGLGRGTKYSAAIDTTEYFAVDPDKRKLKHENFNLDIWDKMHNLFYQKEIFYVKKSYDSLRRLGGTRAGAGFKPV